MRPSLLVKLALAAYLCSAADGGSKGDYKHVHFKIYVPKFIRHKHHTKTVLIHAGGGGGGESVHIEGGDHHDVGGPIHLPQHGFSFGDGQGYVMGAIHHAPDHGHGGGIISHGYADGGSGGGGLSHSISSHAALISHGVSHSFGGGGYDSGSSGIPESYTSGASSDYGGSDDGSHASLEYHGAGDLGSYGGGYGGGSAGGITSELTAHGIRHNLELGGGGGGGGGYQGLASLTDGNHLGAGFGGHYVGHRSGLAAPSHGYSVHEIDNEGGDIGAGGSYGGAYRGGYGGGYGRALRGFNHY